MVLAGCHGGEEATYDAAAKAKARSVAPTVASYGELVSVGQARERGECSEAEPFVAGRCLDVVVSRDFPVIDKPGETTRIDTHVFLWLERERGRWVVDHTARWSPDLVVTIKGGESGVAPPWLYGGYAEEPPPG